MSFLFDPKSDDNIPLEEFPGLFEMQAHTGFAGSFFLCVWLGFGAAEVVTFKTNIINSFYVIVALFLVPFLLAWVSTVLASSVTKRVVGTEPMGDEGIYNKTVRIQIAALSAVFVVWCGFLIWLSGGSLSPFTPFYVMIFSLTLGKINFVKKAWPILVGFLICIGLACSVNAPVSWVIGKSALFDMQQSRIHYVIIIVFLLASLLVPYGSALAVERKRKKVIQERDSNKMNKK